MRNGISFTSVGVFLAVLLMAGGCDTAAEMPVINGEPGLVTVHQSPPPGAPPGTCWGKEVTPAIIETVTEKILLQPAEVLDDGTIVSDPIYKRETRQAIVKERREFWFETPCEDQITPEFTESLQRALKARGLYRGPVTGDMDSRTRRAVRRFQSAQGLNSGILSLVAARKLGLIAVPRPG